MSSKKKWQSLQDYIADWGIKTFGGSNNPQDRQSRLLPVLNHLMEEVEELYDSPLDSEEYADCFILLMQAASLAGLSMKDVRKAIEAKMIINELRTWRRPDENGVCNHV